MFQTFLTRRALKGYLSTRRTFKGHSNGTRKTLQWHSKGTQSSRAFEALGYSKGTWTFGHSKEALEARF